MEKDKETLKTSGENYLTKEKHKKNLMWMNPKILKLMDGRRPYRKGSKGKLAYNKDAQKKLR